MYASLDAFLCFKTALSDMLYTSVDIIILLIAGMTERYVSTFQEKAGHSNGFSSAVKYFASEVSYRQLISEILNRKLLWLSNLLQS
jgi:hypothetical protein